MRPQVGGEYMSQTVHISADEGGFYAGAVTRVGGRRKNKEITLTWSDPKPVCFKYK